MEWGINRRGMSLATNWSCKPGFLSVLAEWHPTTPSCCGWTMPVSDFLHSAAMQKLTAAPLRYESWNATFWLNVELLEPVETGGLSARGLHLGAVQHPSGLLLICMFEHPCVLMPTPGRLFPVQPALLDSVPLDSPEGLSLSWLCCVL